MTRSTPQLNIRSAFARERATALAKRTGMTATQVVEAALRAYSPPAKEAEVLPPGMVRKGKILVLTSEGRRPVSKDDMLNAIEADREERMDAVANPTG